MSEREEQLTATEVQARKVCELLGDLRHAREAGILAHQAYRKHCKDRSQLAYEADQAGISLADIVAAGGYPTATELNADLRHEYDKRKEN